jgi:uncharacterized protein YbaA (DUF1428 family)
MTSRQSRRLHQGGFKCGQRVRGIWRVACRRRLGRRRAQWKVTDFRRAVEAKDDETIVFSWIEWPSKKARDEAWAKLMADPRTQPNKDNMPFDGKRMIYGGFATILDT